MTAPQPSPAAGAVLFLPAAPPRSTDAEKYLLVYGIREKASLEARAAAAGGVWSAAAFFLSLMGLVTASPV